jgi:hypothetical protein
VIAQFEAVDLLLIEYVVSTGNPQEEELWN